MFDLFLAQRTHHGRHRADVVSRRSRNFAGDSQLPSSAPVRPTVEAGTIP